jgi:hypothetical protein
MKTRILIEQNSRLTSLPFPPDQTSYQVGNADGPQIQVPPDWIGDESAIFPPHGLNETVQTMPMSPPGGQSQNTTVQTMPMSSSFTFSLTGARSCVLPQSPVRGFRQHDRCYAHGRTMSSPGPVTFYDTVMIAVILQTRTTFTYEYCKAHMYIGVHSCQRSGWR